VLGKEQRGANHHGHVEPELLGPDPSLQNLQSLLSVQLLSFLSAPGNGAHPYPLQLMPGAAPPPASATFETRSGDQLIDVEQTGTCRTRRGEAYNGSRDDDPGIVASLHSRAPSPPVCMARYKNPPRKLIYHPAIHRSSCAARHLIQPAGTALRSVARPCFPFGAPARYKTPATRQTAPGFRSFVGMPPFTSLALGSWRVRSNHHRDPHQRRRAVGCPFPVLILIRSLPPAVPGPRLPQATSGAAIAMPMGRLTVCNNPT
jgi:hypothetical protein